MDQVLNTEGAFIKKLPPQFAKNITLNRSEVNLIRNDLYDIVYIHCIGRNRGFLDSEKRKI